MPEQGVWVVYILLCRNGAYYVGLTNELARRWEEHRSGRGRFALVALALLTTLTLSDSLPIRRPSG